MHYYGHMTNYDELYDYFVDYCEDHGLDHESEDFWAWYHEQAEIHASETAEDRELALRDHYDY